MSLKRKLATTSAFNLVDYAIRFGAIFVTSPVLIGELGKENYGRWVLIVSIVGYLELLDLGISQTGVRYLSRAHSQAGDMAAEFYRFFRQFYRHACLAALALILIGTGIAWSLLPSTATNRETLGTLLLLAISVALFFPVRAPRILLKSHLLHQWIIGAGLVRLVVFSAGVLILVPRTPDLFSLGLLWVGTLVLEMALSILFARKYIPASSSRSLSRSQKREIQVFAAKVFGWSIASFLRERVDTQVLAGFVSTSAVTQYSVGNRFVTLFVDILNAVFGAHFLVAFARIENHESQENRGQTQFLLTLRACAPLALTVGTGIFLLAPPFIDRWLGPGFEDSHKLVHILTLPTALLLMQYPLGSFLGSQSRHGGLVAVSLIGGALNLVASLVLVQFIGFTGVIWSTAIELTLTACLFWPWLAVKSGALPLREYLKCLGQPTFRLIPAVAGSFAIHSFLSPDTYPELFLAAGAIGFLFASSAWLFLFSPVQRRWLVSQFRKPR